MNSQRGWTEAAARAGYVAKGVVYALIGGLAVASVVDASGSVGGSRNAVETIGHQPFGQFLLTLTGIGMFGYALWRFVQAYFDPEHAQSDKAGTLKRIGYAASGFIHAALGVAAFQMAFGTGGAGAGSRTTFIRDILAIDTLGPLIAVAAGLFIVGFALYQVYKAVTVSFTDSLKTGSMSPAVRTWTIRLARFGLAARGVVFVVIGVSVIKAAVSQNPSQVDGVGGALREIGSQPWGAFMLVAAAGGLAAYGAYQVALARYRKIPA